MKRLIIILLVFSIIVPAIQSKHKKSTPAEIVALKYEKLIEQGALLTPEGWALAGKLFYKSKPYPQSGAIEIRSTADYRMLGEYWEKYAGDTRSKDNRAEIHTKWTDYYGSIDSNLKFTPTPDPKVTYTDFISHLTYSNKHIDIESDGKILREESGPWEWKFEDPQTQKWVTFKVAIEYLQQMRDKTNDPVIKTNAVKSIKALKRVHSRCGSASAC